MRRCKICERDFSTPYSLRRHHLQFHPSEPTPKLERQARGTLRPVNAIKNANMIQYGGRIYESNDENSDDDDSVSMVNNVGSDSESNSESGSESDSSMDSDSEDDNSEDNDNWVFDPIIEDAERELGENATQKDIRKLFRQKLAEKIEWYRNLRKNKIYKKIMATATDLQYGPGEYDREEAIRTAIRQRRILLDRLIPNAEPNNHNDEIDEENDDVDV